MARGRKRALKLKLKKGSITSTISILILLAGALMGLMVFGGNETPFGSFLKSHFGWGVVFLPILTFFLGLVLWRKLNLPFIELRVFAGLLILWLASMMLGSALTTGQGGLFGDGLVSSLVPIITDKGVLLASIAFLVIGLIVLLNASIERVLKLIAWVIRAVGQLFMAIGKGFKVGALALVNMLSGLGGIFDHGERSAAEEILTEKPRELKIRGGTNEESNFEVVAPPSEPVVVEEKRVESNTIKLAPLSSSQILKEETVTNLPLSDRVWEYPPLTLLSEAPVKDANRGDVKERANTIEKTLESFGIRTHVVEVNKGPAVTQYALEASEGTKLSRILSLQNDLALALASPNGQIRIEAPIAGRSLVGIEVPNFSPALVTIKNILGAETMRGTKSKLAVALGLDVAGEPVVADIAKMPHLLIAGSTGSGKSVAINAFITSILFRASPTEVKFILIDPKRVEFSSYNDIPHLLTPVIVEPDKALPALRWAVSEMDRRYRLFQNARVRNITGYNDLSGFQALPYIVVIVDELADLMHLAPVEIEKAICRLAQLARATGIHLVLATQRPSVDVITGLIKANIPTRISFNVTSQTDSRVIIDQGGAEKLLGRGDMLYVPPEASKPRRIQGVFVSDTEVNSLVEFLRNSSVQPEYQEEVVQPKLSTDGSGSLRGVGENDPLFEQAREMVQRNDKASSSLLQRRFSIGYARAARILDELEAAGVVGPANGSKPRDVLLREETTPEASTDVEI